MSEKKCSKCSEVKRFNLFYNQSHTKDGLTSQCKDCINEYNSFHKERKRMYDFVYRQANREHIKKVKGVYYAANRETHANRGHVRRSRKHNNGVFHILKKELKRLYNSPCFYCGSTDKITADHIVPISRGGTHSIGNLVPACSFCNGSKHNKFLVEWKKGFDNSKKI